MNWNNNYYGIIGCAIPVLFWTVYLVLGGMRPEYSMFTKAISELGSVNAPNKWIWNGFGYILTGVLIAIYGVGLYKNIAKAKSSRWPLYGLVLSGLFMAMAGVFPGDFDNVQSTTMLLHTVGSFGSYLFFLVAAFTYPKLMENTAYWQKTKKPTLIFTFLTILFGSWQFVFPDIPAFGQRLVFFFYFLWIFYTAYKLYHQKLEIN